MFKSFPVRIYLVALVLRLIPVILARGMGIGLDDMFQYDMLARSLAQGDGYRWYAQADLDRFASFLDFDLTSLKDYDPDLGIPTSFRAPLYPAFLAIVYFLNGTDFSRFFAARLAQAIFLGAPLAPLTFFTAQKLFPDNQRVWRISAWVIAAYPILLVYPLGLGTENPFFVLLLASILLLLSAIERPTTGHFLLSGIFLGLTSLTRSVILPFAGLVILWAWFSLRQKRGALLMAVAFALTIFPWILRNSLLHHRPTGIETSMGYNLYLGYHPAGNGSFIFGPSLDLLPILDDADRDRIGTERAVGFIIAEPERILPLAINRLGYFFGLEKRVLMYFYSNNILGFVPLPLLLVIAGLLLLPFVLVSLSASLGLVLLKRSSHTELLFLLFIAYIIPHVLILSEDRFHLALVPCFAILAANFWVSGFGALSAQWQTSGTGKILVLVGFFCAVLLLTNWGFELIRDWDKIAQLLGPDGNITYFSY